MKFSLIKYTFKALIVISSCSLLSACSFLKTKPETIKVREVTVIEKVIQSRPAPVPEGVEAYCWEEPMVQEENIKPGLDYDGKWYRPKHKVLREVRQGKWVPCKLKNK